MLGGGGAADLLLRVLSGSSLASPTEAEVAGSSDVA
jgi:hypothetical protein